MAWFVAISGLAGMHSAFGRVCGKRSLAKGTLPQPGWPCMLAVECPHAPPYCSTGKWCSIIPARLGGGLSPDIVEHGWVPFSLCKNGPETARASHTQPQADASWRWLPRPQPRALRRYHSLHSRSGACVKPGCGGTYCAHTWPANCPTRVLALYGEARTTKPTATVRLLAGHDHATVGHHHPTYIEHAT